MAARTRGPGRGRSRPSGARAWFIDNRWPGVRSSVVARTRLIDDAIAASLGEHTEQLVILGAGFDSRAYRLPGLRGITVFEGDHPDTLTTKRKALERVLSVLPTHVRFVAIDFNQHDLGSVMTAAGYRESARTFLLWEGVTNYLTEAAVDTALRWCSRASPGSLHAACPSRAMLAPRSIGSSPQICTICPTPVNARCHFTSRAPHHAPRR